MNTLQYVPYSQLTPIEGLNSRQFFDPAKGAELRASIREHGVQETLLVAATPGQTEEFGIIAGERRWRETRELLAEIKVEIEAATDAETVARLRLLAADRMQLPVAIIPAEKVPAALELNLVENLCRADITPLEEAEGYERLRQSLNAATGLPHTIVEVARKVSREESYVTRRLKLRLAPAFFLEAVNQGIVAPTIAEKLGRIPDPKAREEAARLILNPVHPAPEQEVPLNHEQAVQLIREHFMVTLVKCGFDPEPEDLVPVVMVDGVRVSGGSCGDCPWRSGNLPDLADELRSGSASGKGGLSGGIDPNLCTNPSCHAKKRDAAWASVRKAAEAKGQKVIDGDAARKVFGGYNGAVAYDSTYRLVAQKPDGYSVNYSKAQEVTFAKLIEGTKVETVVARNPHTGKIEQLVDHKKAIEAAKKAKPELFDKGAGNAAGKAAKTPSKEELERQQKQAVEDKARACIMEMAEQRLKVVRPDDAEVNALLLEILIESWSNNGTPEAIGSLLDLPDGHLITVQCQDAIRAEMAKEKKGDGAAARRWMQIIVVAMAFDEVEWGMSAADCETVLKLGKVLGVDVKRCFSQAEGAVKGAAAEEGSEGTGAETPKEGKEHTKAGKKAAKKAAKKAPAVKAKTKAKGKRSE